MRIRTIKPEFWQSEDLSEVSDKAKLLAIGLLNIADDEGYLKAHPAVIKSQIFPFSDNSVSVQDLLIELSNANYLTLLTGDDGKSYALVKNFTKHQKVNRPTPSKIRGSVEFIEQSVSNHEQITIGKERKGKEQGKEQGKESNTNVLVDGKPSTPPYEEIKNLYNSTFPMLPACKSLPDARKTKIRGIWRTELKTIDDWKRYFEYVKANCTWVLAPKDRGAQNSLDWFLRTKNLTATKEGAYDDK